MLIRYVQIYLVVLLLTGCAALNGTSPPEKVYEKAIIFINNSLVNTPKASGDIRQIDNELIPNYGEMILTSKIEVNPGNHRIVVSFYSDGYSAAAAVKGELESNHVYEIVAVKDNGARFTVTLEDVLKDDRKIIDETSVYGVRAP